jgi:hypothetical protein
MYDTQIPDGFWNYSAPYSIKEIITYPRIGPSNGIVQFQSGVFISITLVQ